MNRLKESNIFSGGGVTHLNNRRTLLKSYIWNYVVSNSGKATLENSIKGDIDLELGGKTEQVQTSGKNLANANVYEQGYLTSVNAGDKVSLTQMQKSFTTNMEVSSMQGKNVSVSVRTKEKTGKKYVFTDETDTIITGVFDTGSNNYSEFKNITIPKNAKKLFFSVTYDTQENTELQVELGTTVTTYEPYTGGKPSPSPEYPQEIKNVGKWNEETQRYEVDVKVTGKNLFDREKAKDVSNWISIEGDGYLKFPIRVKKGSMITFSYTEKLTEGKKFYLGIAKKETGSVISWLYYDTNLSISNSKYTIAAEEDYVYLMCNRSAIQTFLDVIKTLQVEISQTQTEYEPYQEPQPLTLTSDRPITKWDKLVERSGQYGWLYGGDIKTFENDVFKLYADNEKAIQYQVPFEEISNSWSELVCYCNTFENAIGQTIYTQSGKTDFYMGCVHKSMVFSAKNKQGIFQSIEAFQEWIRNSGTYVWYKTDNKKFVPLSESEQTQLRNLHSYNGTTHITADSGEVPCGIKVAYKQKT